MVATHTPLMVFAALVMEAWLPSRHARQRKSRKHDGVMKLRQMGHDGVVGFASGYAARPQRTGSGGHLLRHWLEHIDARRIALVIDARDKGLASHYARTHDFRLVDDDPLLMYRLPQCPRRAATGAPQR